MEHRNLHSPSPLEASPAPAPAHRSDPQVSPDGRPPSRLPWPSRPVCLLVALVLALAILVVGPRTPRLDDAVSGDRALAAQVHDILGSDLTGATALHVSVITPDGVRHAGLGHDSSDHVPAADTPSGLASVTKTFTGQLLADAVTRGEVSEDDRLETYLPELTGTPTGGTTLGELASHRAGLPLFPPGVMPRIYADFFTGWGDTASVTTEEFISRVGKASLTDRGTYSYSDLGATLLGHALARATGYGSWGELVSDRLLKPVGMTHTVFASTRSQIPGDAVPGNAGNGRNVMPWVGEGSLPSGAATWTTPADMAAYAQALLVGTAPGGTRAMEPRWDADDGQRVGLAWHSEEIDGRTVAEHDGGAPDFATMLMIDPARQVAVYVTADTFSPLPRLLAKQLIQDPQTPLTRPGLSESFKAPQSIATAIIGALAVVAVLMELVSAERLRSRATLAAGLADLTAWALVGAVLGPWDVVPSWTFVLLAAAAIYAALRMLVRWRTLPWLPARLRWWAWMRLVLAVAWLMAAVFIAWPKA